MTLLAGGDSFRRGLCFGSALSALSERLVVSVMLAGERYRAVFCRGMLVSLLSRAHFETPLGINWFTFLPDASVLGERAITLHEALAITANVEDRTGEEVEWG